MSILLYGLTFLGTGVALGVGGTYTILAAEDVFKSSDFKKNASLQAARKYLSISSSLAWVGIALIITIIILYIVFGIETIQYTGQSLVILLLLLSVGLTLAVGSLAIVGASDIKKSGSTTPQAQSAYKNAIIASVITVGGLALLVIGGISIVLIQNNAANKRAAQMQQIDTLLYERILRAQDANMVNVPGTVIGN